MASSERSLDSEEARVHRVLAHTRRRHVLDVLSESDSPMTLADLAADIASRESDETADREYIEQVQISLYHNHIPTLDDTEGISITNRLIRSQ